MRFSDHQLWELLKEQDDAAWREVYADVVLAEAKSLRSAEIARRHGITPEDLLGRLYEDMVGKGKLALYRDDGASIRGWLRTYVRGYVLEAVRKKAEEISLDASDSGVEIPIPTEDPAVLRREKWNLVQDCFVEMWRENPLRAYVHLLKLRMNLSSREIKGMLGISSEANVDQIFSRAVKDMREAKVRHEEC